MYPTIHFGEVEVSTQALVRFAVAWIVAFELARRVRGAQGYFTARGILGAVAYLIVGAAGGSWLGTLPSRVMAYWQGAEPPPPFCSWMGALGGASLMGYLYCRRRNLPAGMFFDVAAPLAALALALGRIGCLLRGCCYGKETTSWLALLLPDINGVWAYRYPTRIVSLIANLIIFALLLAFERYAARKHYPGWPFREFLFLLYVELYSLQRFYFEFWRGDMPHLVGPFTWTHLYCLIGIGLATRGILHRWRRKRNKEVISKRGLKCSGRSNIW